MLQIGFRDLAVFLPPTVVVYALQKSIAHAQSGFQTTEDVPRTEFPPAARDDKNDEVFLVVVVVVVVVKFVIFAIA